VGPVAWEIIPWKGLERAINALNVFDLSELPLPLPFYISLAEASSSTTVNVARATSDESAKLSAEEVGVIKARGASLRGIDLSHADARAARARGRGGLGCAGHSPQPRGGRLLTEERAAQLVGEHSTRLGGANTAALLQRLLLERRPGAGGMGPAARARLCGFRRCVAVARRSTWSLPRPSS
jgi:hypothetical protein